MARTFRVAVIGGHAVIAGVVRLACDGSRELELVGEWVVEEPLAPEVLLGTAPDVLVLDLDLRSGGIAQLGSIRQGGYEGPTLVLSERSDGPSVLRAMRAGADGYLVKARGLRTIGDAIVRVAGGERVLDPVLEREAVVELGRFARQAREGSAVRSSLSPRELEVLVLLADGLTTRQIGRRLGISGRTVEAHVSSTYRKLGVRTRVQAVSKAASLGLVDL